MKEECIKHIKNSDFENEDFECHYGNNTFNSGFYPCDVNGNITEPIEGLFEDLYVCAKCAQIYKQV